MSSTVAVLVDAMSESTQNHDLDREETDPTFAAAICASKPLAIDLAVKMDPPSFGAYHTEPGSCTHELLVELRDRGLATHVVRSGTVAVNPRGLGR